MVVVDIDSILRLFKDYAGEVGIPQDSTPVKLLLNPTDRKVGLVIESDEWTEEQPTLEVRFDLQRFYGVGGSK